jgi:hypothetical protein
MNAHLCYQPRLDLTDVEAGEYVTEGLSPRRRSAVAADVGSLGIQRRSDPREMGSPARPGLPGRADPAACAQLRERIFESMELELAPFQCVELIGELA